MGNRVVVPLTVAWKLGSAVVLVVVIVASVCLRAPRRTVPTSELRRLVVCSLGLYVVGAVASVTHHRASAAAAYGAGISVAALAAWLSRGRDQEDPPGGGDEPVGEQPPPQPDGVPRVDWARFEREFREYALEHGPSSRPSRVG